MNKWKKLQIGKAISFNPPESILKGSYAKKIPMGNLTEYQRKINSYEVSIYNSGPKFRNGDTIMAKITPCLENGKTAYVDILEEDEIAFGSSEYIVLRETEYTDAVFNYYLAISPTFRKRAISCMEGTSGRKRVSEKTLKYFELDFPPLETQKQIAKVLSDLDAKIEVNNNINQELEAMAKTLYDYWFVQFDFPDANGKPYRSSGGKMVFNEALKREIPEGWEVKFLTEEMDLQYGFPFSTKLFNSEGKGVPVIRIRDILNCTISNYSTQEVDGKYKLYKGDIVVGMDGNFHINYWNKEDCYLNQRSLRIRSNKDSISEIQTRYSIEPYIKAREKNVSRTTVAHLSARDVNDLKVLKATEKIQSKANDFFKSILDKIVSNREQNQKLAALRDWLLPMLMNGQVTVTSLRDTKQSHEGNAKDTLGMVAEPGAGYEKDKTSLGNLFKAINYDYEVATIVLLTRQRLDRTYGKKYIHKMFSNIEFLNTLPIFKQLEFKENGWGMFSSAIAKTIENKKFILFEDVNNKYSVLNFNYKHIKEVSNWMKQEENQDFVSQVNNMITIYEESLINKDMDRIELLNTVLECMRVLNTDNLGVIRAKMQGWFMKEDGYANKAEKFSENETMHMIRFINELN